MSSDQTLESCQRMGYKAMFSVRQSLQSRQPLSMDDRTAWRAPSRSPKSTQPNSFAEGTQGRFQPSFLSSSVVGSVNRGLVIQALFDLGPTSRAELARLAGVNRTTISGIVQSLIDDQVLVETEPGQAKRGGGKPARPLWFSPSARPICGVLLMPDAVRACLTTLDGAIIGENRISLPAGDGPVSPIIEAVKRSMRLALADAAQTPLGVGVAVGGMVDTNQGSIVAMNLAPALDGYPLADELGREFGLPVRLDHHPRALLVGDRWFGKGRGAPQFAVIYTGEVLGGAFYFDGHLYRGVAGAGGELGHTFVQVEGELCRCGRRGCWDTIATLSWLRRQAEAAGLPNPGEMNSGALMRAGRRRRLGRGGIGGPLCPQHRRRHRQRAADIGAKSLHSARRRCAWRRSDDRCDRETRSASGPCTGLV